MQPIPYSIGRPLMSANIVEDKNSSRPRVCLHRLVVIINYQISRYFLPIVTAFERIAGTDKFYGDIQHLRRLNKICSAYQPVLSLHLSAAIPSQSHYLSLPS